MLPKDRHGCPFLILAPMEGVGDRCFRQAMASVGGFDEAVKDFLRVPSNAHIPSLAEVYCAEEIAPIPLIPQIMGSDLHLMGAMASELERRGAIRIDINCGCPSNTVTGKGAGSSLLKEPSFLYQVAKSVVDAVSIPVTLKMRSGYADTSLFQENLLAVEESGVQYITLHPRTKVEGYGPPARWDLIAKAKSILRIPVVGNGDVTDVKSAIEMLSITKCDGLMIGRGSIINPFIFHQIRAHFSLQPYQAVWEDLERFFDVYISQIAQAMPMKVKVNKLKQIMSFLFKATPALQEKRREMLLLQESDPLSFLNQTRPILKELFFTCIK